MKNYLAHAALLATTLLVGTDFAECQTYRKDYRVDAPIKYQASDPWDRGFIFRNHINHAGFFYNCDGEECKRNSPYLFYTQATPDCRLRTRDYIKRQLNEVRWRVQAGGCGEADCYPGCDCEPGVNLNCNVRPDSVNIDYSDLSQRMAMSGLNLGGNPGNYEMAPTPVPQKQESREPTLDYYRPSQPNRAPIERPSPGDGASRIRLHPSILAGTRSQSLDETVEMARRSNAAWSKSRMSQSVPVREESTTSGSGERSPSSGVLSQLMNRRHRPITRESQTPSSRRADNLFAEPPFEEEKVNSSSKQTKTPGLLRSALIPIPLKRRR